MAKRRKRQTAAVRTHKQQGRSDLCGNIRHGAKTALVPVVQQVLVAEARGWLQMHGLGLS